VKNSHPYRRGDLTIASFVLTALVSIGAAIAGETVPVAGPGASEQSQSYTVRLSVTKAGFEPRRVAVPLGSVRFVVTSRDGDHCFAIPSLDVEKRVRRSTPLEVEVLFEREGEFPFLCCVEGSGTAEVGTIVVAPAP